MIRRALLPKPSAHLAENPIPRAAAEMTERSGPIALSELPAGSEATLAGGHLPVEEMRLLEAMGLSDRSQLRVCRQGEPCIVESRSIRVGISRAVARHLHAVLLPTGSLQR